ncbi:hypothetical protein B8V81_0602 [Paenibacillus pasadenensis]|uniref:Uncharacterized protein n=1 Tax=Paenibacillus pasadenensis TaxID=217090 RepID=A0A2N5NDU5_9BACL|nr:hypothetical protein B8V81_0602 [Paenibacillus pasadenensis]
MPPAAMSKARASARRTMRIVKMKEKTAFWKGNPVFLSNSHKRKKDRM